jgi:hypothetical protein
MKLRTGAATLLAAIVVFVGLSVRLQSMNGSVKTPTENTATPRATDTRSTPVLVELFTSEGCSDCPPADALLRRLGRTQPVHGADVIVLEEHVDYWDRLGWKDPFSSESATARQGEYGEAFGGAQVYTPQMVVDGHAQFVGSSESNALRAIRTAIGTPKPAVHLTWSDGGKLAIQIDPLTKAPNGDPPEVYLAVTENMLRSDVKRGENAGRALEHDGVVRRITAIGKADSASTGFSSTVAVPMAGEWNRANLRAVVFVQERRGRRIVAASAIPFPAV